MDATGREIPLQFPRVAADAVALRQGTEEGSRPEILLITRKKETFQGCLAFPGGHVDYGEDPEVSCVRELKEETDVDGKLKCLLTVRGKPGRDPRYHVLSVVYIVEVDPAAQPKA